MYTFIGRFSRTFVTGVPIARLVHLMLARLLRLLLDRLLLD